MLFAEFLKNEFIFQILSARFLKNTNQSAFLMLLLTFQFLFKFFISFFCDFVEIITISLQLHPANELSFKFCFFFTFLAQFLKTIHLQGVTEENW